LFFWIEDLFSFLEFGEHGYPFLNSEFESSVKKMFFAGSLMHEVDYMKVRSELFFFKISFEILKMSSNIQNMFRDFLNSFTKNCKTFHFGANFGVFSKFIQSPLGDLYRDLDLW
jgi:hypothetical protein